MPPAIETLSRWHHSVDDLSTSSVGFYESVEKAVRARELPVAMARVQRREHGVLSATRQYLEITYMQYVYIVSAMPFGKNYYFGWWLGKKVPNLAAIGCGILLGGPLLFLICLTLAGIGVGLFLFLILLAAAFFGAGTGAFGEADQAQEVICALPLIGKLYQRLFNPVTFYTEEARTIFEESIHRIVLDVVAGALTIGKMAPLTEAQKEIRRRGGQ